MEAQVEQWRFETRARQRLDIPPDGCMDVIGRREADGRTRWFVFALAERCETADIDAATQSRGFRLAPGVGLAGDVLPALAGLDLDDARAEARIFGFVRARADVGEALAALRESASVEAAARALGVHMRRLERVCAQAGAPPRFWLSLARARRAGRALAAGAAPFAEVAMAQGYCDQAHLGRAMRRWFARSPRELARDGEFARALAASGYD
jgi:AraC-like DNA-binding protein